MAFMRRQTIPIPETETDVWNCTNEECAGWMRKDFTFDEEPACPLCNSGMTLEVRTLPEIQG